MAGDLPDYYFRIRENGAAVFRLDAENRQRRIEMEQIAVVNIRNGEVKPHGQHHLTEADKSEIARWTKARRETLAARSQSMTHTIERELHPQHRRVTSRPSPRPCCV